MSEHRHSRDEMDRLPPELEPEAARRRRVLALILLDLLHHPSTRPRRYADDKPRHSRQDHASTEKGDDAFPIKRLERDHGNEHRKCDQRAASGCHKGDVDEEGQRECRQPQRQAPPPLLRRADRKMRERSGAEQELAALNDVVLHRHAGIPIGPQRYGRPDGEHKRHHEQHAAGDEKCTLDPDARVASCETG